MQYFYVGSFPPPYGGVTIKNNLLLKNYKKYLNIKKVDLSAVKNKRKKDILNLLQVVFNSKSKLIIGVSGRKSRRNLTKFLYFFKRKVMQQSVIFIMGGVAHNVIAKDKSYQKWMRNYKKIYVETFGMKEALNKTGLHNVEVFPNCRERMELPIKTKEDRKKLKMVFFSKISEEKGVKIILEASKQLVKESLEYEIDFYGKVDEGLKDSFFKAISNDPNVTYKGLFEADKDNVYKKLQEYDLLLFPTKWKAEGVPGILIEAKIASLPAIVSNLNFNSEIVNNGFDGLVLKENNPDELKKSILFLANSKDQFSKMEENAKYSAENYYIDTYISRLVNDIEN